MNEYGKANYILAAICIGLVTGMGAFGWSAGQQLVEAKKQPTVIHYRIEIVFPG
jgi:hypothetical protein